MSIFDNILAFFKREKAITPIAGLLPAVIRPVIIVPGFLGCWPPQTNSHSHLDPITHVYDGLWEVLQTVGYVPGVSLFQFGYDWRQGLEHLGLALGQEIRRITSLSSKAGAVRIDYSKVDILAHSYGGLVSRTYLQGDTYADNVARFFCIASPHQGTTAAYYGLADGDSTKIGIPLDSAKGMLFIAGLHDKGNLFSWISGIISLLRKKIELDLFDSFGKMAAIQSLLPLANTRYLYTMENGTEKVYPFGAEPGYPVNSLLEKLNSAESLERLDRLDELIFFFSSSYQTQARVKVEANNGVRGWQFGKALAEQPPDCYAPGDTVVPAISGKIDLPPYKRDSSLWHVRWQAIEMNQVLQRGVNHIDIVGDPDAARFITNMLLDSTPTAKSLVTAGNWDAPKLGERKPNFLALFF